MRLIHTLLLLLKLAVASALPSLFFSGPSCNNTMDLSSSWLIHDFAVRFEKIRAPGNRIDIEMTMTLTVENHALSYEANCTSRVTRQSPVMARHERFTCKMWSEDSSRIDECMASYNTASGDLHVAQRYICRQDIRKFEKVPVWVIQGAKMLDLTCEKEVWRRNGLYSDGGVMMCRQKELEIQVQLVEALI